MNPTQEPTQDYTFPLGAIVTREPDADDLEQVQWAEKALKDAPASYNTGFRQVVTLASVMLAGSCGFFNQVPAFPPLKITAIIALLVTLGLASFGLFPVLLRIDPDNPAQVRAARKRATVRKGWLLVVAGWLLLIAMAFLAVGVVIGESKPQ